MSQIIQIIGTLILALVILIRAASNMITKRRWTFFMPFFGIGLALCLAAGFMFYGFFGIAFDVYLTIKLTIILCIFIILWRRL